MLIKVATPEEWEKYKEIRLNTLKNEPQAFSSTYEDALNKTDEEWQSMLVDQDNVYMLACIDHEVIGAGRIALKDEEELPNTAVLCGLYVEKEYREQGVAKALLTARLEECSKHQNIEKIRTYIKTNNKNALSLYEGVGFEKVDVKDDEYVLEKTVNF